MSLVRPICAACGEKTEMLAVVSDPFSDSCYGLCRSCIGQTYAAQTDRLRESLAREALRAEPAKEHTQECNDHRFVYHASTGDDADCICRAEPAKEEA